MKKAVVLVFMGSVLGALVFFLRRDVVCFITAACDALTLSGGAILLFSSFGFVMSGESADGIRYAFKAGLLGLFPFARTQSFRRFKEERREGRGKRSVDKESLWFGGSLFLMGVVLSFFIA